MKTVPRPSLSAFVNHARTTAAAGGSLVKDISGRAACQRDPSGTATTLPRASSPRECDARRMAYVRHGGFKLIGATFKLSGAALNSA